MNRILRPIATSLFFLFFSICYNIAQSTDPVILQISNAIGDHEIEVSVVVVEFTDVLGMQFGLEFNTEKLEYVGIKDESGLPGFNYGTANVIGNQILFASVFDAEFATTLEAGTKLFTLTFHSLRAGESEIIGSEELLAYEAVKSENGTTVVAELIINSGQVTGYGNGIFGQIYYDENKDCLFDNEQGIGDWPVEISDGTNTWSRFSDSDGNFSAALPFGSYTLKVLDPSYPNWVPCDNEYSFVLEQGVAPDELSIGTQITADCPILEIDMNVNRLRRCFSNNYYYIDYINRGLPAQEVSIEFEPEEFLSVESSSIPITSVIDNIYTFDIGDLDINEGGHIRIITKVDCDNTVLGQTLCAKARILPKINCGDFDWNGPELKLTGDCVDQKASFTVTNAGTANMVTSIDYSIVEDDLIMPKYIGEINLNVGEKETVEFSTEGKTIRFEIPQIEGHPFAGTLNAFVEACGEDENGKFSVGFANMFPNVDPNPQEVIVCEEIIGSWDPNDKAAAPLGYKEPHWLKANTDISYKIRFQNTGTDTAFNIVIRDTLSEHLDLRSLQVGPSSHDYEYIILNNKELVFSFNNIMLPDSNVNEVASHGFVTFKIGQKPNLKDGTKLYNKAGIYFDFNDPIITNEVFHTIGEEFIDIYVSSNNISDRKKAGTKISPNPFKESSHFSFNNDSMQEADLEIIDMNGRTLYLLQTNNDFFEIKGDYLSSGIYFYKLSLDNSLIDSGKLIVR